MTFMAYWDVARAFFSLKGLRVYLDSLDCSTKAVLSILSPYISICQSLKLHWALNKFEILPASRCAYSPFGWDSYQVSCQSLGEYSKHKNGGVRLFLVRVRWVMPILFCRLFLALFSQFVHFLALHFLMLDACTVRCRMYVWRIRLIQKDTVVSSRSSANISIPYSVVLFHHLRGRRFNTAITLIRLHSVLPMFPLKESVISHCVIVFAHIFLLAVWNLAVFGADIVGKLLLFHGRLEPQL